MTDGRIVSPFWAFEGKERKRRGERGGEGRGEIKRQRRNTNKRGAVHGRYKYKSWRGAPARTRT